MYFISIAFFYVSSFQSLFAAALGTNDFISVLCDLILLFQGRIGRALILISFLVIGINFLGGKVSWQDITKFSIGVGFFLAPITIVSIILPNTIKGLSGELSSGVSLTETRAYTPEYIIISVCPELAV